MRGDLPSRSAGCRVDRAFWTTLAVSVTLLASPAQPVLAQEVAVPVEVQVPLLFKILPFDRNLQPRMHGQLVVGILFQSRFRTSATVAEEVHRALEQMPSAGNAGAVRSVMIDFDNTPELAASLTKLGINILYVAPLRAVDVGGVATAARSGQITTLTGVPRYVEGGLAVGIDLKGERPQIVVNLAASRAEGADFSAQLLKLARVVDVDGGDQR